MAHRNDPAHRKVTNTPGLASLEADARKAIERVATCPAEHPPAEFGELVKLAFAIVAKAPPELLREHARARAR